MQQDFGSLSTSCLITHIFFVFELIRLIEYILKRSNNKMNDWKNKNIFVALFTPPPLPLQQDFGSWRHVSFTYLTKHEHEHRTTNVRKMAGRIAVDLSQYWDSFTQLRKVLLRNISLLSLMMFPLTYQVICVEFLVEEQSLGACNYTGRSRPRNEWNLVIC